MYLLYSVYDTNFFYPILLVYVSNKRVVMFERDENIAKSRIFDSKLPLLWPQKCCHDPAAKMSRAKSLWRQLVVRIDNMAESERKVPKSGGRYCVAGLPNNESCKNNTYTPRISMHTFPLDPGLRAQWVKYVKKHRVDFGEPVSKFGTLWNGFFCQSFGVVSWLCENKRPRPWCNPYHDTDVPADEEDLTERQKWQVRANAFLLMM